MDESTAKSPIERIIALFARHGIRFVLIEGQAELLHGSARVTFDIDICYERSEENLVRLAEALRELNPTLRGAPADLPFRLDARSLALGSNFTFATDEGALNLLGYVEPLGGYAELAATAESVRMNDIDVRIIALEDLIRIKEHLGRPKDREALLQLKAIRRIRGDPSE